jgi:uncharacterized protein with HEPN domain
MQLKVKKLLYDVQEAAEWVASFSAGRSFEDYVEDRMLRSAVERQFEIMGEALSRLAKIDPEIVAKIQDYRKIIGFRNVLIHGYDLVQDEVVWSILMGHLPTLAETVKRLLAS